MVPKRGLEPPRLAALDPKFKIRVKNSKLQQRVAAKNIFKFLLISTN